MSNRILDTIDIPADIKALSYGELLELAQEIRNEIIATTSKTGGHLASSLGAVELILALHSVLDCPKDKLIFDVGHQAYAHKLITGRRADFDTLRTYKGMSGFTKRDESIYDVHDSGHASDSLSTAVGLAVARDLEGGDEHIVAIIGDGSISGGMAFEAMNQIGQLQTKMTIILNDNEMSISRNVGALSLYLAKARMNPAYLSISGKITHRMSTCKNPVGRFFLRAGLAVKDSLKQFMVPGMLFEDYGIKYLGPIDGHDIRAIREAVAKAKTAPGPVIIHAITQKGRGYLPAENRPDVFHGVGSFDEETGESEKAPSGPPSYTQVFSDALIREAESNKDIVAITAAMPAGTGLDAFAEVFPGRTFDVGIAEEHAVTFASGLAIGGKIPVIAIYSTFLQRAYDQIIINVALQNQHVVFAIDRAGLVGADGPTHHGVFDISYLRLIPNMQILAPSNERELVDALHTALYLPGPVALRYPRGNGAGDEIPSKREVWTPGQSVLLKEGNDIAFLAVGRMVAHALEAAELLEAEGVSVRVVDMRWIKPIDEEAVIAASECALIVTVEEGVVVGGFGDAVLETLADKNLHTRVLQLGVEDAFVAQGDFKALFEEISLSPRSIAARVRTVFAQES
ncbi:MAG: 1-deoxy-D-xylulose-5-phosphate synthase [Actinobacteria bacterium]|nr:1-deoxy-D-xylulose-5-phosphate synthase [Actinomycetota bacterium]